MPSFTMEVATNKSFFVFFVLFFYRWKMGWKKPERHMTFDIPSTKTFVELFTPQNILVSEERTKQTDWQVKQAPQGACFIL